jgi:hypothetical protein
VAYVAADTANRFRDTSGNDAVVILDQDGIVESEAVV